MSKIVSSGRKFTFCAASSSLAYHRQKAVYQLYHRIASLIAVFINETAAFDPDGQIGGKGVYHRRAYSVKASAGLVSLIIKFAAGVEG